MVANVHCSPLFNSGIIFAIFTYAWKYSFIFIFIYFIYAWKYAWNYRCVKNMSKWIDKYIQSAAFTKYDIGRSSRPKGLAQMIKIYKWTNSRNNNNSNKYIYYDK